MQSRFERRFERRDEGKNYFNGQIRISIILLMAAVVISVIVAHLRLWKSTEVLRHTILCIIVVIVCVFCAGCLQLYT